MRPGDVLDERYRLDVVAGRGGGGTVVRALDLASGQTVAIKLMRGVDGHQVARFSREVAVLASLGAPGIVRFLGSGNTPSGMPYLVMEWVEGESLAARLSRGRLSVEETLAVARAVAAALAVAHAHGVVHRDVKPSNVLLEAGAPARPKLLDFGIARRTDAVHDLTDTGQVVGTYAYMAPEQAWARHRLGPPADVFALGCVLFECLTGRKAFRATDGRAVLAKVLLEDPPRVRELRADVPPALDRLVGRMLAKDPSLRPSDGAAMVSEIDALSVERPSTRADGEEEETTSLTTSERRVFVVVVARAGLEVPAVLDEPGETDATLVSDEVELLSALGACGARAEVLADGSVVAVPVAPGMPTDQAVRAARCALTLRERLPAAPIAIATGLGETTGGTVPTGDVIERAFAAVGETRKGEIVVDVTTASLLGSRFDVRPRDAVLVLVGEATGLEGRRLVLGRVTPFVGRERELAVVAATWLECVEEPAARAFVVVGSAGTGKTRLQQEIVERLGAASAGAIEVLLGRGDPIRDGAPFGVAGDLLRRACAVLDGEPIEDRRTKLLGRVRALLGDAPDAESTAWFLGEIAAVPFDSAGRELLRSARADAMLMADLTSHAWVRWLGALTDATPVLLVLEDLHWGDEPSLRLVGAALRQLERRALLVLAMTRPETPRGTEQLLRAPGATELRLPRLGPRAATALVREVLGDLSDLEVSRIVKQADGHPFYLEELLRERATAPAAAPPGGAPTSVLAMLHARLAALPEEQRRVLRVGSVYGGRFWRDAVAALVRSTSLDVDLDALVRAELVSPVLPSTFPGVPELAFRHDLVREAAYETLTERDREVGHRAAAEWLEQAGVVDALVLAEHYRRGGVRARALTWYRRAAEQALASNDLAGAVERVEHAMACDPDTEMRGALRLLEAEACRWLARQEQACTCARDALASLEPGVAGWFQAVGELARNHVHSGPFDETAAWVERAVATVPRAGAETAKVACLARCVAQALQVGREDLADRWLEEIDRAMRGGPPIERATMAVVHATRSARYAAAGEIAAFLRDHVACVAAYEEMGDARGATTHRINLGYSLAELGRFEEAEETLLRAREVARELGLAVAEGFALQNLSGVWTRMGRLPEARAAAERAVAMGAALGHVRLEGGSRKYLARVLLEAGDAAGAEQEARRALVALETLPPQVPVVRTLLARALAAQGRAAEALIEIEAASAVVEAEGTTEQPPTLITLTHVEVLLALGRVASATSVMERALRRLHARAVRIEDPSARAVFLTRLSENARTLDLSADLGVVATEA